jgi:hypothetical protein
MQEERGGKYQTIMKEGRKEERGSEEDEVIIPTYQKKQYANLLSSATRRIVAYL